MSQETFAPVLDATLRAKNFADIAPAMTIPQALSEANRCLYCSAAPCTRACPTGIDVPEFIRRIATGNLRGSAEVILESNILGGSCARVCPTDVLCEGACVFNHRKEPAIEIGRLQRHAIDHAWRANYWPFGPGPRNGKKVAAIGGGPASLAFGAEMSRAGYHVTIFEAKEHLNGLNTYGVAPYKITWDESLEEARRIVDHFGLEVRLKTAVGRDVSLADLEKTYEKIFIGVGLGATSALGIPGEDLPGVIGATEWIEELRKSPGLNVPVGRRTLVVGLGNTAIDAATEAARLGSDEVTMVYRRSEAEKPCYHFEFELAKADKVHFVWNAAPVAIEGKDRATGLRVVRTRTAGRGKVETIPGSEFTIQADMIVKSTGQRKLTEFLGTIPGLTLTKEGKILVDAETRQTSNPRYYAGGDCVNGGKEVVNAAADGKAAAFAAHEAVTGKARARTAAA